MVHEGAGNVFGEGTLRVASTEPADGGGEPSGRANEVTQGRLLRGGRRSGIRRAVALAGLAAALIVVVAAAGLLAGQRGPNPGATWTLRPDTGQGEWTGLTWSAYDPAIPASEVQGGPRSRGRC